MKILIVRHGDPDYSRDSLTEKGWREAEYLSERLARIETKAYYVSPLGRAKDTASCTLKKVGRQAVECEWLREFSPAVRRPDSPDRPGVAWDWLPQDWLAEERFLTYDRWMEPSTYVQAGVREENEWVVSNFDAVLASHGYRREGKLYRAEAPNEDTIVFFCHFGVECVLLGHLLNLPVPVLWHAACAAPSAVTTLVTEERREGRALFRMSSFGDISHLYVKGEEPAFAARFCECFYRKDQRHD